MNNEQDQRGAVLSMAKYLVAMGAQIVELFEDKNLFAMVMTQIERFSAGILKTAGIEGADRKLGIAVVNEMIMAKLRMAGTPPGTPQGFPDAGPSGLN